MAKTHLSLDRFRIRALERIIESKSLTPKQRMAAIKILKAKCGIYASGCLKGGRADEAFYDQMLAARYPAEE